MTATTTPRPVGPSSGRRTSLVRTRVSSGTGAPSPAKLSPVPDLPGREAPGASGVRRSSGPLTLRTAGSRRSSRTRCAGTRTVAIVPSRGDLPRPSRQAGAGGLGPDQHGQLVRPRPTSSSRRSRAGSTTHPLSGPTRAWRPCPTGWRRGRVRRPLERGYGVLMAALDPQEDHRRAVGQVRAAVRVLPEDHVRLSVRTVDAHDVRGEAGRLDQRDRIVDARADETFGTSDPTLTRSVTVDPVRTSVASGGSELHDGAHRLRCRGASDLGRRPSDDNRARASSTSSPATSGMATRTGTVPGVPGVPPSRLCVTSAATIASPTADRPTRPPTRVSCCARSRSGMSLVNEAARTAPSALKVTTSPRGRRTAPGP